jgi:hypothetical protein
MAPKKKAGGAKKKGGAGKKKVRVRPWPCGRAIKSCTADEAAGEQRQHARHTPRSDSDSSCEQSCVHRECRGALHAHKHVLQTGSTL